MVSDEPPAAWHASSSDAVALRLETDAHRGITESDAISRRSRHGRNELPEPTPPSSWARLIAQLADPLVGALLVAAVVAALVAATTEEGGSWADAVAILLIVVLNAGLGFVQERRAEQALAALRSLASPRAKVVREGEVHDIDAALLVPGDVIELHAGDRIPADARLVEATHLTIDEAVLTGESGPVGKSADAVLRPETTLAERENLVFTGTTVVRGNARGLVVATGTNTELGRIGALLESIERDPTPLERRLARLGTQILVACIAISVLVFVIGWVRETHAWTTLLLIAVSLAVAAIPEGLPTITTITLALGMQRMARRGAIVRKLPAVETLGSATVICSDKTGTLTENALTVRVLETADEQLTVTGLGYESEGELLRDGKPLSGIPDAVERLVFAAVVANDAHLRADEGRTAVVGDPTEGALLVLGRKLGVTRDGAIGERRVSERHPFDSDRKRMSVMLEDPSGEKTVHVKGAPDVVLARCDRVLRSEGAVRLTDGDRRRLLERTEAHASRAMRVLALAERSAPGEGDPEVGLVYLGLVGMIDAPREGVKEAVAQCHDAGIRVVMITGDHRSTGVAIARELDIYREGDLALDGAELIRMNEADFMDIVDGVTVYARVTAEQKLEIVRALEHAGHVVAMTGDGVNDAPALKEAAIGVAMGKSGTDVARQAAELVLVNDDFASIVVAIGEGRAIFRNIQKFVFFLGSSNAGLVVAVVAVALLSGVPQLTPLQLLWINLVTNGLPALALGVDPPDSSQMRVPPTSPESGIVGWRDFYGLLLVGAVMGAAALSVYALVDFAPGLFSAVSHEGRLLEARTMAFLLLAVSPLFHAHNCRSPIASIASVGLFSNLSLWAAIVISAALLLVVAFVPALQPIFRVTSLGPEQWGIVVALAALPIPVVEALKAADRARARPSAR